MVNNQQKNSKELLIMAQDYLLFFCDCWMDARLSSACLAYNETMGLRFFLDNNEKIILILIDFFRLAVYSSSAKP